jgi:hypothetical protein
LTLLDDLRINLLFKRLTKLIQYYIVELFRAFAGNRQDVRLLVVGARYTRDYEVQYVQAVKDAINGDPRIELHDVTDNVDPFYEVCSKP